MILDIADFVVDAALQPLLDIIKKNHCEIHRLHSLLLYGVSLFLFPFLLKMSGVQRLREESRGMPSPPCVRGRGARGAEGLRGVRG